MKKTRLISLLLTAALAVSCLPMAVSADTDEAENLLDGATYEAVVETTENEDGSTSRNGSNLKVEAFKNADGTDTVDGNKFYTIAKRARTVGQGFTVTYTLTAEQAEQQLYFDFDLRHSQPAKDGASANAQIKNNGTLFVANGTAFAQGTHGSGNWYALGEKAIPVSSNKVGSDNVISYSKGQGVNQTHNIDIDNIRIYYRDENNEPVYIVNITENFEANGVVGGGKVSYYTAIAIEDTEKEYYIANSDAAYNTEININLENTLEPGVYKLGGEFRFGEFRAEGGDASNRNQPGYNAQLYYAGLNDADVFFKAGGSASEAVNVDDVWYDHEWEIVVTEATDVITLIVDGNEDTIADPQCVNFRDLTLVQTASFSEELVSANEENLLDGTVVTYNGAWERGDGYLSIPARTSDMAYEFIDFTVLTKPVAGVEYFLAFDVCSRANGTYQFLINGGFTTEHASVNQYNTVSPYPTYESGTEGTVAWGLEQRSDGRVQVKYDPVKNVWQHVETSFIPVENKTDRMKFSVRGKNTNFLGAIDFDNIKLWYFNDDGEKVVVYSNEFNSAADLDTKTGTVSSQFEALGHEVIPATCTITPTSGGATAFYDVAAVANKDGEYTFSATVASETEDDAYLVVNYADKPSVESEAVKVTAEGVELTFTADGAIESIELVTEIEDVVVIANESLTYSFEAPMGDATSDGKVTPLDVVYFQRYLAGWAGYADLNADVLDLNGDGTVEMGDAVALARHLAQWIGYETIEDIFGMEYDA